MSNFSSISEAESVVMEVLWGRSPLATGDIVAALTGQQEWPIGFWLRYAPGSINKIIQLFTVVQGERGGSER